MTKYLLHTWLVVLIASGGGIKAQDLTYSWHWDSFFEGYMQEFEPEKFEDHYFLAQSLTLNGSMTIDADNNLIGAVFYESQYPVYSKDFSILTDSTSYLVLTKRNTEGDEIWTKSINVGVNGIANMLRSVNTDSENSIYITGEIYGDLGSNPVIAEYTNGTGGRTSFLIKFDSQGNHLWTVIKDDDLFHDVEVSASDVIYLATKNQGILKFTSEGEKIDSFYVNAGVDDIDLDEEGNIYGTGNLKNTATFGDSTISFPEKATDIAHVFKLNSNMELQWVQTIESHENSATNSYGWSQGQGVTFHDGQVYTIGFFSGFYDYDINGTVNSANAEGKDGSYLINLDGETGEPNYFYGLDKTTIFNAPEWSENRQTMMVYGVFSDELAVETVNGDSLVVSSNGGGDLFLVQLNDLGKALTIETFCGEQNEEAQEILFDKLGNLYLASNIEVGFTDIDPGAGEVFVGMDPDVVVKQNAFYVAKYEVEGIVTSVFETDSDLSSGISLFPNPAASNIEIRISDYDVSGFQIRNSTGMIMHESIVVEGESTVQLDISEFEPGIYFLMGQGLNEGDALIQKFIKQ
jgi:hypothetical protein